MTRAAREGVDPNELNEEQLMAIAGIGPETARRIVQYREEHGPIHTWDELQEVLDSMSLVPSEPRNASPMDGGQQSGRADPPEVAVSAGPLK